MVVSTLASGRRARKPSTGRHSMAQARIHHYGARASAPRGTSAAQHLVRGGTPGQPHPNLGSLSYSYGYSAR